VQESAASLRRVCTNALIHATQRRPKAKLRKQQATSILVVWRSSHRHPSPLETVDLKSVTRSRGHPRRTSVAHDPTPRGCRDLLRRTAISGPTLATTIHEDVAGDVVGVAISVVGAEVVGLLRWIDLFLLPHLGPTLNLTQSIGGDELTE
jgi:hypothetical protein